MNNALSIEHRNATLRHQLEAEAAKDKASWLRNDPQEWIRDVLIPLVQTEEFGVAMHRMWLNGHPVNVGAVQSLLDAQVRKAVDNYASCNWEPMDHMGNFR